MDERAGNLGSLSVAAAADAARVIADETPVLWALVQNDDDSAGDLLVGGASAQHLRLSAGQMTSLLPINDLSTIWVKRQAAGSAAQALVLYGA